MIKTQRGFTIVELLIVIVVIGVLAAIVTVTATGARARAVEAQISSDMQEMRKHLEAYYADVGGYPATNNIQSGAGNTWMRATFQASNWEFLRHPYAIAAAQSSYNAATNPVSGSYSYRAYYQYPTQCNEVELVGQCQAYRLAWFSEVDRTVKVIYVAR